MENILGTKLITQIGILVHDIEATSQAYAQFFGAEKPQWSITDEVDKAQTQYRGKRSDAMAKLAFFDMGSLQLELIEPDHNPSTWRESLDKNGEGPHHVAFVIKGMKEKIAVLTQPDATAPKGPVHRRSLRIYRHIKRLESNHRAFGERRRVSTVQAQRPRMNEEGLHLYSSENRPAV